MAKKNRMQAEIEKTGQQEMLMDDIQPENANEIIEAAQLYKKFQAARLEALEKEVAQKNAVLALMKKAELTPVDTSGKIIFRSGGFIVTVQPRDEKITVKEESEE